jgi:uncharacterized protein YodC (DUF2158 family)
MSEENKIEIGDVATLNSGGPLMTVEEVRDNVTSGQKEAHCVWISNGSLVMRFTFPSKSLRVAKSSRVV